MRRLTEVGESWRDYLYANHQGKNNDIKDFITRVYLISDSQEQLLETMLEDEPNMELVKECKEEIAFQREKLEDMAREFADYYNDNVSVQKLTTDDILNGICKEGTNSYLYEIEQSGRNGERKHTRYGMILMTIMIEDLIIFMMIYAN